MSVAFLFGLAESAPFALPRTRRVLRSSEFKKIYESGTRLTGRYFAAFCLRQDDAAALPRFGFTVPRAVGKAVERNRIRRRMREAVRSQFAGAPANWTFVFNPRRSVLTARFENLCREIAGIFARCKQF